MGQYALIYINDDDIPELIAEDKNTGAGMLYTIHNCTNKQIHSWDGPRVGGVMQYAERKNWFITYYFASYDTYAIGVEKINENGEIELVSSISQDGSSYYVNDDLVNEAQFYSSYQWIEDNFTDIEYVSKSTVLNLLKQFQI